MKKAAGILLLALLISLAGCAEESAPAAAATPAALETDEVTGYEFKTETYTSGKIVINYPQLVNLDDSEVRDSVNAIIKEGALRENNYLVTEAGAITYELDYDVMYSSFNFISIRYTGYSYVDGAAHPDNFLFTTNIDVGHQSVMRLKDLVTINAGFVEAFKGGIYCSMYQEITPEYTKAVEEALNESDTTDWIAAFKNADTDGSDNNLAVYSFLTGGSLVISVFVPHYMGDFIEIAISKEDLADYQTEHAFWADAK
jgi:hypothetical protein